jgi:hypothetical protein
MIKCHKYDDHTAQRIKSALATCAGWVIHGIESDIRHRVFSQFGTVMQVQFSPNPSVIGAVAASLYALPSARLV